MAKAEGLAQGNDAHPLPRTAEERIRQAGCWTEALCLHGPFSTGAPCKQHGHLCGEWQLQQA